MNQLNLSLLKKIMVLVAMVYIFFLLIGKLAVLFTSIPLGLQISGFVVCIALLVPIHKNSWLPYYIFLLGLSAPLFGSAPYSLHTYFFELFLNVFLVTLIFSQPAIWRDRNRYPILTYLLFGYFLLSFLSLLLLPIDEIVSKLILWDAGVFWNAVIFSTPSSPFYSFRAVNSLFLYSCFVVALAFSTEGKKLYHIVFVGLLVGAFWSSFIGILNYYGILDLDWLRVVAGKGKRLQSVFANPGWFAEFLTVTVPYVLLLFISPTIRKIHKTALFGVLILCETAIFLTYSRTGWLVYPLVLCFCWFFFYLTHQTNTGRYTWSQIGILSVKIMLSVPLTIATSYFLIFHVFAELNPHFLQEKSRLENRLHQLTNPVTRKAIWLDSLMIIEERPVWGHGYESYRFQSSLRKNDEKQWDTPHSMYLQLLTSGGVVGLTLWGLLIFMTIWLLVVDLIRNKAYFNIAIILSIAAFHMYGIVQAMQYIPVIWFLLFLNIGYAHTLDEKILPMFLGNYRKWVAMLVAAVFLGGLTAYGSDIYSHKHAERIDLKRYALDQEQDRYRGFYPPEHWEGHGIYRWSGPRASLAVCCSELYALRFVCSAPNLKSNPLVLSVYEEDELIDKIAFVRQESILRNYYLSQDVYTEKLLRFEVSRTWNLRKLGAGSDSRSLGVAVSEPRILEHFPPEGLGFYDWEQWTGGTVPGLPVTGFVYRWTSVRAVFDPADLGNDGVIHLRAGQPGLPREPLVITIGQEDNIIQQVSLSDTNWHSLVLPKNLMSSEPCTLSVSRTWIPQKIGVTDDARVLGVAVAGIARL